MPWQLQEKPKVRTLNSINTYYPHLPSVDSRVSGKSDVCVWFLISSFKRKISLPSWRTPCNCEGSGHKGRQPIKNWVMELPVAYSILLDQEDTLWSNLSLMKFHVTANIVPLSKSAVAHWPQFITQVFKGRAMGLWGGWGRENSNPKALGGMIHGSSAFREHENLWSL